MDDHQPRSHDDAALGRETVGPHHQIGDPGLVLQRDEAHPLGAPRALPDQHQPGQRHPPAIAQRAQFARGDEPALRIMIAQELHRVRLQAQPHGLVIAHHMLAQRHRGQSHLDRLPAFVARLGRGEQGQVGRIPQRARIPQRGAAIELH